MTDTIVAALITAGGAICGALITHLLVSIKEGRNFFPRTTERQKGVDGMWTGKGQDTWVANGTPLVTFGVTLNLKGGSRKLKAMAEITTEAPLNQIVLLEFSGGFFDANTIQFSYRSVDARRRQFGVAVFELSLPGTEMTGYYAGLSPTRGCYIQGRIDLSHKGANL